MTFVILALVAPPWVHAQTQSSKAKVAKTAGIPRSASGKPDLSGIWQTLSTADWDLEPHHARADSPAGLGVVDGPIPYQEWALLKKKENFANRVSLDPAAKCFMPGIPRATYKPFPFQIFQSEHQLTVLYEFGETARTIHANGSKHPDGHIDWWLGDSRGHWEGDTLVVDVIHFNDKTWFDRAGNFHSDELHVVERYTLIDRDTIEYHATIEDPKVFTRPWSINLLLYRHKEENFQLLEYKCFAFDLEKDYP
ncbi:MAG TPA: hypothetical protein VK629_12615 [Steroidobacteraceae bacterium]|nr:hypothetical protein [Steroidobacteraceae bacterium]